MASSRPPPSPAPSSASVVDVSITIVSAKHLKNVNWRHGDLKPYAVLYLVDASDDDDDTEEEHYRRFATKPDDAGSTRPVWNEKFTLPVPATLLHQSTLAIEIFHSKPSETPKPLVGTVRCGLKDLIGTPSDRTLTMRTLELRRPSGRPQGKIRIKLSVQERPLPPPSPTKPQPSNYYVHPPSRYYHSDIPTPIHTSISVSDYRSYSPPPPPPQPSYPSFILPPSPRPSYFQSIPPLPGPDSPYQHGSYSDPYRAVYYSSAQTGYYSAPPAPSRITTTQTPFYYDRMSVASAVPSIPSAPLDHSLGPPPPSYEQRAGGGRMGTRTGLAVGAVAGAVGGLTLEEGLRYEEEKVNKRVESDRLPRDDYSDYRADY